VLCAAGLNLPGGNSGVAGRPNGYYRRLRRGNAVGDAAEAGCGGKAALLVPLRWRFLLVPATEKSMKLTLGA